MRYVSVNYNYSPDFSTPESWVKRTAGYTGILECLSKENEVISVKQINYRGNFVHKGVDYRFVDLGKKRTFFPIKLNHYIKDLSPDIVIIQGLHRPLQFLQLRLLLGKKTKVIAHHHAERPFEGLKKYLQALADVFIDAYLFASYQIGLDWVERGIISSAQKIHEVMEVSSVFYPISKAAAKLKTGVTGDPVFLWVGRLNQNKDPLTVVKAFLAHAKANPGARMYMIYHTDELLPDIKQILDKDDSKNAIITVGKVEHDELINWYNSADFFLSGSHYEGSGTALCEAMSCGCIPVVTDIFSFRMITDHGNCGLLYEAGNETALLTALSQAKILDIKAEQKKALTYFRSTLSFEAIADKISGISGELSGRSPRYKV